MTTIHREALVSFSAQQMYDLVNDIASYPEFIPMCRSVEVHQQDTHEAKATLHVAKGPIKMDFGTHNIMQPYDKIDIQLLNGPFKSLNGAWQFIPLTETACKVKLDLEFEFSNILLAKALGVVFSNLANTMLDAFCQRAKQVYRKGVTHGS